MKEYYLSASKFESAWENWTSGYNLPKDHGLEEGETIHFREVDSDRFVEVKIRQVVDTAEITLAMWNSDTVFFEILGKGAI